MRGRCALCDVAEIHEKDLVVVNYRIEPVGDRQDGSVSKPAADELLHDTVGQALNGCYEDERSGKAPCTVELGWTTLTWICRSVSISTLLVASSYAAMSYQPFAMRMF